MMIMMIMMTLPDFCELVSGCSLNVPLLGFFPNFSRVLEGTVFTSVLDVPVYYFSKENE